MYKEITTVEAAMGKYPEPFDLQKMKESLSSLPASIVRGMIALATLQVVVWAVNNDDPKKPEFKPDYNKTNQYKWAPWFRGGDESGAGFRFFDSDFGWTSTTAFGGARLALKDEQRADHMAKYFEDQYKELLLILR